MAWRAVVRPGWTGRKLLLGALAVAAVTGIVGGGRLAGLFGAAPAAAEPPAAETKGDGQERKTDAPPPGPLPDLTDYSRRVVAYIGDKPVTREQLGEYLIARRGTDRVQALVNKLIIEKAGADRGLTVTDAEVDATLAENMASLKVNRREFVQNVLKNYHKSMYEWREDVLRPKLLMTKLLREKIRIEEEELRKAYESAYGEKVQCQMIVWRREEKARVTAELYAKVRDSADEFNRAARTQFNSALAAAGGMTHPIGKHGAASETIEKAVFALQPGEVSPLLDVPEGIAVVKVVRRIPADADTKFEDVRAQLEKEIVDRKIQEVVPEEMRRLCEAAAAKIVLTPPADDAGAEAEKTGRSQEAVAYLFGNYPVTREQLGEYLISRYGGEKIDLLVNKLIIDEAATARGATVTEKEVEDHLAAQLERLKLDRNTFVEKVLKPNRTTLYEYRHDVIRPQLMMSKLLAGKIKVEEEDVKKAFEAYHGEKVECQLILWPRNPRERELAIRQYDELRKNADEFDRVAKMQASPRLAATAGRIDPFGRNSTGHENLEREVFRLREGEITPLLETPEGYVVAKLLKRIPCTDGVKLEDVRAALEKEVLEKKTQLEIPQEFQKLRAAAAPNILIRSGVAEEELLRQVQKEVGDKPPAPAIQQVGGTKER